MMLLAKLISLLLNPLIVLIFVPYILIQTQSNNYAYILKWTLISSVFTIVMSICVLIGVRLKIFSNFDVSSKKERPLLFLLAAVLICIYSFFLLIFNGPKILLLGVLAIVLGLVTLIVVNRWIKVSIHIAILISFLLLVGIVYKKYYFLLLFLVPLLMWSRIKTKRHTLLETIVGGAIGALLVGVVYTTSKLVNTFWLIYNK